MVSGYYGFRSVYIFHGPLGGHKTGRGALFPFSSSSSCSIIDSQCFEQFAIFRSRYCNQPRGAKFDLLAALSLSLSPFRANRDAIRDERSGIVPWRESEIRGLRSCPTRGDRVNRTSIDDDDDDGNRATLFPPPSSQTTKEGEINWERFAGALYRSPRSVFGFASVSNVFGKEIEMVGGRAMVRPEAEMMVVAGASEREREGEGGQQRLPPLLPSLPSPVASAPRCTVRCGTVGCSLFVVRCAIALDERNTAKREMERRGRGRGGAFPARPCAY